MITKVTIAYLVVFGALFVTGLFIDVNWWQGTLIGLAAMTPVAVATIRWGQP